MDKPQGFIVCRQASDPLKPGYRLGYECAICKKPLQVSPTGIERREKENLLMLCNPCGIEMAMRLSAAGQSLDMQYTADFLKSFKSYVEGKGVP